AQTGHSRAVSYSGLVADADHSQAAGKELLNQVILFVVESGAAKVRDCGRLHQGLTISGLLECALAAFPEAVSDHVHGRLEVEIFPLLRVWPAIFHFLQAPGMGVQFVGVGALWAEMPA